MAMNGTLKKVLNIILRIFTIIVVILTVCMMIFTIISVNTFDQNDRSLFGIRFYIVQTDSMSLSEENANDKIHFDAGDIVMIKNVDDKRALEAGEVIAFISQNTDSYGATVTHMIKERRLDENGKLIGYVTYGTYTGAEDQAIVEPEYVIGSYAGRLIGVGTFFQFLKTTPGYIVCILVPFLLLILYQGVNCITIFRRYKKEQLSEMEEERAKLEEERRQSLEMMKELQALKAQLANQNKPVEEKKPEEAPVEEIKEISSDEKNEG